MIVLDQIRVGRPASFGPRGDRSSIATRSAVAGPVMAGSAGLAGDEVGDAGLHGAPDKAIHHYPADHYAAWAADLPALAGRFMPGAMGENFSASGLTEAMVCLGDRFRLGRALLELSQARQPCWKLNVRFDQRDMARRVQDSGRTGWYWRVVEPGLVAAGDGFELVARPHPAWTLARVHRLLYVDMLDRDALAEFIALPGLTPSWMRLATRRLDSAAVEDWLPRLEGQSR